MSEKKFAGAKGAKPVRPSEEQIEAGRQEIMKVVEGVPGAEKISELIERGKKKGKLSASQLMDVLEGMDLEIAQRIIDFTSGATFAIDGNLQKISNYIFLVTPANVDISGDLQDLLGNSLDTPPIQNRY